MKQIFSLFFLLFLLVGTSRAQTYQWVEGAGSVYEDRAFGVTTDISNNIITTGQYRGPANFGPLSLNGFGGLEDVFVAKYDGDGSILWVFGGGGSGSDIGFDVVTDNAGNIYVAGQYYNSIKFGNITLNSSGSFDFEIFVLALDPSGNVLWAKSAGGNDYDVARGIAISGTNLFVAGNITGTAQFGNINVSGPGLHDVFVASYTLNGTVNWAAAGGSTGYDVGYGVAADAAGNAYATGYFQGQATFGSNTITNPSNVYIDAFLVKVNSSGSFVWARNGGNNIGDDAGRAVATDPDGNVYMAGEFRGTATFNGISKTSDNGTADIFVAKYAPSGDIQYVSTEGGQGGDYTYGIDASASQVFITGLFNGTLTFGGNTITSTAFSNDIYLAALNAENGIFDWGLRAGGTGNDAGRAVSFNSSGFVAYAGDFEHDNSTFGALTLNSIGTHDIFTAKVIVGGCEAPEVLISPQSSTTFCQGGSVLITSTTSNASAFQWKKNGAAITGATSSSYLASTPGVYTLTAENSCGTAITSNSLTVQVNKPPAATVTPSGTVTMCSGETKVLSANTGIGLTYQWFKNGSPIPGATNSNYTATTAGKYKVTVTRTSTGCFKTSKTTTVTITCKIEGISHAAATAYPNPSSHDFLISLYGEGIVEIWNTTGQIVNQFDLASGSIEFGSDLLPGIYFAHINYINGEAEILKLIKE